MLFGPPAGEKTGHSAKRALFAFVLRLGLRLQEVKSVPNDIDWKPLPESFAVRKPINDRISLFRRCGPSAHISSVSGVCSLTKYFSPETPFTAERSYNHALNSFATFWTAMYQ